MSFNEEVHLAEDERRSSTKQKWTGHSDRFAFTSSGDLRTLSDQKSLDNRLTNKVELCTHI